MQVTRFVEPLNVRMVAAHLGLVLQLLGAVLVPPFLAGLLTGEFLFGALYGGLALGAFGIGKAGAAHRKTDLGHKEALVITALAYPLFALVGALGFLPETSFIDGFFEAMSGFTTTGLTVVPLEGLPRTLLFFRAYAQWVGGAGIIVLSLVILLGPGKAAFQLYASEFKRENVGGSVIATARVVVKIYGALTVLLLFLLLALGLPLWDALLHAMTTISTGGFSIYGDSIGHYQSAGIELCLTVFMLLSAVSFPLYYVAVREGPRRFFRDLQLRYLLGIGAAGVLFFIAAGGWEAELLRPSLFNATSALTGTGFQVSPPAAWAEQARLLSLLLMIIGGSAGSTTGGIKLFRLILMVKLALWVVVRRLLPEEARLPMKYGELVVADQELKEVFGFFALYIAFLFLSGLLLSFSGAPIEDALFESASALGTVGLSSGLTSPGLAPWAKLLLTFEMWAGRLEILPLLVLLYPGHWRRERKPE